MQRKGRVFTVALLALLCLSAGATQDQEAPLKSRIEKSIGIARAGGTDGARDLAELTRTIGTGQIDGATIADIASLLDSPDDMLRFWIAVALGNLGTPAKIHAPKLQALMAEDSCRIGTGITAGGAAEFALKKMGMLPFPTACPPKLGRQY